MTVRGFKPGLVHCGVTSDHVRTIARALQQLYMKQQIYFELPNFGCAQ
jgi:hypothetical protein